MTAVLCDICKLRPTAVSVPVFANVGTGPRRQVMTEHWCFPCHQAVLAKYPGETMWPRNGIWLAPKEIPA